MPRLSAYKLMIFWFLSRIPVNRRSRSAETLVRPTRLTIVIDSVAALTPRVRSKVKWAMRTWVWQARLMSQALRKLTAAISKANTCIIFINQIRMKIGVMFGNPETTTGGRALKFYASVRIDLRKIESVKSGENIIANRVKAKIVKNKWQHLSVKRNLRSILTKVFPR